MRQLNLTIAAFLTIAGCSQVLGLGDYEIDKQLDGKGGSSGSGAEAGAGGEPSPSGGAPTTPAGGEPQAGGSGGAAPEVIECDSLACCTSKGGKAVGVELLGDGGFELGPASEELSPWLQDSTFGFEVVSLSNDPDLGFSSRSGDYYAYLSGLQGERSSIYSEDLEIPQNAGWLTLSGYRLFQIDIQDDVNDDFSLVAFYDPDDEDPVELPFWWGMPTQHADGWGDTETWRKFEASWDAVPHRGAVRYLGLRGESDSYPVTPDPPDPEETYSSSFLFDDISLKAFTCVK